MRVAIYGCADYGKRIMKALVEKEDTSVLFIDNSIEKIGTNVDGIDVVSLYRFIRMYKRGEIDQVVIPNYSISTVRTMKNDLRKNGVCAEDVLIVDSEEFVDAIDGIPCYRDYKPVRLPYIQYVSFEAAEKCNLNCKRCDHFSNLKRIEESETVEEFQDNMMLLSQKVESIGVFAFLGGEPLLNKSLNRLLYIVKECYPKTQIIILTNGLLLRQIPDELVQAIRETQTIVKMTLYPPLKDSIEDIVAFMRSKEIQFELSKVVDEFWTQINPKGDSNAEKMLNICVNSDCVVFKNGRIAKCPITMNSSVFNDYFDVNIPRDILDLRDESVNVDDIRKYLYNPIRTCAYCGRERYYEWEQTNGIIDLEEMRCLCRV